MTTTCTITKEGRCDTYGRPLLVGQRYTSSDDEIRSLWQAGFCSVTDAPDVFEKVVYPYPQQVAVCGVPFVIPPGDGAANGLQFTGSAGAFTLSAAIMTNVWNALKGCWVYMPTNFGGSGLSASWRWAVFSSDTAGVLYQDTYVSGNPTRVTSPTAFATNLTGWITTTTSEITGPTGFVLSGGSMGPNGKLKTHLRLGGNITASKSHKLYLNSTNVHYVGAATTQPNLEVLLSCANQGSESLQSNSRFTVPTGVGLAGGAYTIGIENTSINTAIDQTISMSLQISTTAACAILTNFDTTCTYGA